MNVSSYVSSTYEYVMKKKEIIEFLKSKGMPIPDQYIEICCGNTVSSGHRVGSIFTNSDYLLFRIKRGKKIDDHV